MWLLGVFEIVRPVRLLDFDTLTKVYVEGSHFDPEYHMRRSRAGFLGRAGSRSQSAGVAA